MGKGNSPEMQKVADISVLFKSLFATLLFPLPITAHPHLGTHRVSTNHCSIKQPSSSSFSSYVVPIFTHVTKNNQTRLWSQTAAAPHSLSYRPIFLPPSGFFDQSKTAILLPPPPPSLHSICLLKPRIHDYYSGSP